jgi:hypothetical protein
MKLKFTIGNIASLFTVLLGIHIYLSYLFISGLLESYGINAIPTLSMEDLFFSFGKVNAKIFLLALSGFIISLLFDSFIYRDYLVNGIQSFISWVLKKDVELNQKKAKSILLSFFSILILIFSFSIISILNTVNLWIMFLMIFVIPTILIFSPKQRTFFTILQFIFIVIWLNLFAQDSIDSFRKNETYAKSDQVSFKYLGQSFHTGNDTLLVFLGYEKMVISFENNKKFMLIPTDQIQNLTYVR